jgi:hypothetical protein
MRQRITAALTRRRLGGAVLVLAGITIAAIVLWPDGDGDKTAVKPLPVRIVSIPPLGIGFAHPRTWKRSVSGETLRLTSPDGSLVLIFASPFDRPGAQFAQHEARTTLLKRFAPAKIVSERRAPLGRMGLVRTFELTGERDNRLIRALVYTTATQWRTYVVTMLTGENPSKRRLTEANEILDTVSFSKPRKI